MLQKRRAEFSEEVWRASARLDCQSPTRIADDMIGRLFPVTVQAAEDEGATTMFRKGVVDAVKRVLSAPTTDAAQTDFAAIDPAFAAEVRALQRRSYFVEARDEYVSLAELIREPILLDDARRFMRRKGEETIAEADRLDQLYRAVMEHVAA